MARYQCSHYEQKPIKIKNQAGFMSVGWWCKCCGGIKITHHVPLENQRWHVPTSATEWNRLKKEVRHYMELALKFGGGRADT